MANQDFGRGQQYDEDITDDQWAQQGGQQQYTQSSQGMQGQQYDPFNQGQQYDVDPGSQGTMPDPSSRQGGMGGQNPNMQPGGMDDQDWLNQQSGLSEDPLAQDSPFGEGEQPGQGMSRRDRAEDDDIDSAFGNP